MHTIDSLASTIEDARIRNYEIWPVIKGTYSIQIIDLTGRTVYYSQSQIAGAVNTEMHLTGPALSDLEPGFYAVLVKNKGTVVFQQKIIKQ